jgi:two-component system phosphate regulon sensor histidine kinase PhoR
MTLRDVTEERRLEETRRNFTIDAGHELQTPLTAIRAAAELLAEDFGEAGDPEKRKLLATIMRHQERMTSLIDDLLLLVKLEGYGGGTPPREAEDLMEMLSAVAEDFGENPAARYVTFDLTGPEVGEAPFKANRPELLRAFSNVLDNAVRKCGEKYGEKQGGRVSLDLRKEAGGSGLWMVTIEDNGPGVSPEAASQIFKDFYCAHSAHIAHSAGARRGQGLGKWGSGGHGLGLSIAARIIKSHGGSIDLLPGLTGPARLGGAVFEIRLPG